MPSLGSIPSASTELEAVNVMLAAAGEAPISDLATATQGDVEVALNLLRNAVREVCTQPWRFNTEYGYELEPDDTYNWVDREGTTTTLNVFLPPSGMLTCTLTPSTAQLELDLSLRKSRRYQTGDPLANVKVFYDRSLNRDGLDADKWEVLYINPVWLVEFTDLPESARRYCIVRAARQFLQQFIGSSELSGFTREDELFALRALSRDEGQEDHFNIFNHSDMHRKRGWRFRPKGSRSDTRSSVR